MRRRAFLCLGLALAGCTTPGVRLDVPYVQTPMEVVAEMLRIAEVRAGDVVYDLGCGDGRIVIAAAMERGARGVGIDIDPVRIAEANADAARVGVAGKVRFLQQDLFQSDFSEATVVTLFLLPELNRKLLPKFLAELKPGTRIVSHEYGIGDWAPRKTVRVELERSQRFVHLWVVPAR